MGIAVGIDLGTTNTVVGAVRGGRASTLADETGARLIPSVVSFLPSGTVVVGEAAKERRIQDPANTIYSVKRLIGRPWTSAEVQRALGSLPFSLQEGPKQSVTVTARGETYTLPEISAFVLRRAKQIAEQSLGETVDSAVITVPANFNDLQRAATKLAGKLAGLEVLRILNEPTAAALAYGQATGQRERIAVYDLGGGTFDITLLDLSGKVYEVLATGGDSSLGGDDFDLLIASRMAQFILENHRIDLHTDRTGWAILRSRAEKLKHLLSSQDEASIDLDDVAYGEKGAVLRIRFTMTRAELESLAEPLVAQTLDTCRFSLETVGVKVQALDRLLLVGGATRMPLVARTAQEYFQRSAAGRVSPDEVVALGAAIQAFSLNRSQAAAASRKVPTMQVRNSPDSSEPRTIPGFENTQRMPVARPVDVPAKPKPPPVPPPRAAAAPEPVALEDYSISLSWAEPPPTPPLPAPTTAKWPRRDAPVTPALPAPTAARSDPAVPVPPAPAAVLPAAPVPAATVLVVPAAPAPAVTAVVVPPAPVPSAPAPPRVVAAPPLLIDVTPLSLGVEVAGGFTDVLITANTPVPCDRARVFRTASDGQTAVVVRVSQGEFEKFDQNTCLGDMELTGIKAGPRGEAKIEVVFEIDADGILNVRAKDMHSGHETAAKMRLVGARNEASEVEQMMSRQERHPLE